MTWVEVTPSFEAGRRLRFTIGDGCYSSAGHTANVTSGGFTFDPETGEWTGGGVVFDSATHYIDCLRYDPGESDPAPEDVRGVRVTARVIDPYPEATNAFVCIATDRYVPFSGAEVGAQAYAGEDTGEVFVVEHVFADMAARLPGEMVSGEDPDADPDDSAVAPTDVFAYPLARETLSAGCYSPIGWTNEAQMAITKIEFLIAGAGFWTDFVNTQERT